MKKRALRCSAVGDTSVICGSAGDLQRRFPGAARSHALGLLVCFCVVSVVSAQSGQGPSSTVAEGQISPTLYFASAQVEIASRRALHSQVDLQLKELPNVRTERLRPALDRAWKLYSDLQRHEAYLRLEGLENIQDEVVRNARHDIDTDQSILESSIYQRIRQVHAEERPLLGPYALLARNLQDDATAPKAPDVEKYRSSVTFPHEEALANNYDLLLDSLPVYSDVLSLDNTKRRSALEKRNRAYDSIAPTVSFQLASIVDLENRDAFTEGFENAAERKYHLMGLSGTAVEQVLAAIRTEAPVYKTYQQLLAEHAATKLAMSPVLSSETELSDEQSTPIPFATGQEFILAALKPLGLDYTHRFREMLDPRNGRADLAGGSHRAKTGTSIAVYDAPVAFYYSGYSGSMDDLSKIIHEGGHAIHRELMNAGGAPIYERTGPHFMMEGFAVFNELLLLEHFTQIAQTRQERQKALERFLAKLGYEVFVSAEETDFERRLYAEAKDKGLLSRSQIDAIYEASLVPYEYWPMSDVGQSGHWIRKNLLFEDPLYLINYLYASLIAVGLYERSVSDPDFAEHYEALLRRGFDEKPSVLLASIGIDLSDPMLVASLSELFKLKTKELRALYAEDSASH